MYSGLTIQSYSNTIGTYNNSNDHCHYGAFPLFSLI